MAALLEALFLPEDQVVGDVVHLGDDVAADLVAHDDCDLTDERAADPDAALIRDDADPVDPSRRHLGLDEPDDPVALARDVERPPAGRRLEPGR